LALARSSASALGDERFNVDDSDGAVNLPHEGIDVPPEKIDSCKVLAYAIVPAEVPFTDVLCLIVGGVRLGRVPRLAICEWDYRPILMLFHCDDEWNSLGVQGWEMPSPNRPRTVADVVAQTERYYPGLGAAWVLLPASMDGTYAPSSDEELDNYWRETAWERDPPSS
jgi:hypothetical protein